MINCTRMNKLLCLSILPIYYIAVCLIVGIRITNIGYGSVFLSLIIAESIKEDIKISQIIKTGIASTIIMMLIKYTNLVFFLIVYISYLGYKATNYLFDKRYNERMIDEANDYVSAKIQAIGK